MQTDLPPRRRLLCSPDKDLNSKKKKHNSTFSKQFLKKKKKIQLACLMSLIETVNWFHTNDNEIHDLITICSDSKCLTLHAVMSFVNSF